MFGHNIALNFEQNGDTYNTYTGGFVSILLRMFLTFYVCEKFYKMLFYMSDTTLTNIGTQNLNETG